MKAPISQPSPTTEQPAKKSRAERRGNRAGASPSFKAAPKDTVPRGGKFAMCGS